MMNFKGDKLEQLKNLASDIHGWDIYLNIKEEILNIKVGYLYKYLYETIKIIVFLFRIVFR